MASIQGLPENSIVSTAATGAHSSTWATDKDWTKYRALIEELYSSHTLAQLMRFMESEHRFKATTKMYKRRIKQWDLRKNNSKDWTKHRALIGDYYGSHTLAEVVRFMESEHRFKATTKMYKRRIKQWGLCKAYNGNEMRAALRKIKERLDRGKRSDIHVRGRAIDDEQVIRYWRRKGVSIDDVIPHRAASVTPEAVEIVTPVPSRVATPTSLAVPERIFAAIRNYFEGSFASGHLVYDDPERYCNTRKVKGDPGKDLDDVLHQALTACQLFEMHLFQEAGRILISLTSKFEKILFAEHPHTLADIFKTVMNVRLQRKDEIGMAILRQFCAWGEFVLGKEHPLCLICGWLASADAFQFDEIIMRCFQSVTDQLESFVGPMHYSTLALRTRYINDGFYARNQVEKLLQNLLRQCELHLGSLDDRTRHLRHELSRHYFRHGQYTEALRVGQDLIVNAQYGQSPKKDHISFYTLGLSIVAQSQWALGQMLLAEANLRKAIELRVSEFGERDSQAGLWLVYLEQWLMRLGQWSSAAEIRETRMGMLDPTEVL